MSDGQFWSARITNGNIEFFRGDFVEGTAYYHDKPELFKYLVLEGKTVHEVSQEQKDIIDAAEAQAIQDRLAQENIIKQQLEEQQAIQDTYAGNYNPNIQSIWAKQSEAENLYLNTIKGNAIQKENLATKYGFCYEYLSRTYGFIIN